MTTHTTPGAALFACLLLGLLLWPAGDALAARHVGNVVVIEDTFGNILPEEGMCDNLLFAQGLCVNHAANAFYMHYGDDYDVLVMFTTKMLNPIFNVAMGFPVQKAADGIGLSGPHPFNPGQFGSDGRLIQCVKMGDLNALPDDPNDLTALPPITAVELMAHEVGHQWMVWIMLDLNDGRGSIPILRGYEGNSPNGHWSAWYNSGSVMYGGILTDNGDGTFTNTNGPRKFSQLDQYLMGIRAPEDVEPQWYVNVDGSSEGSPAMPGRPGTTHTFSGTRVNFTVEDIIRANGPRVPAESPCHLKFAFILYHEAGMPPFPAQIEKVERHRDALEKWWPGGTDYRGSIDTRLSGCGLGTEGCPGWESRQCATWVGDDEPVEPGDCTQGQTRCASLVDVQICTAAGTWVYLTECDDGQHCDAGACVDESGNPVDGDRPDDDLQPVGDTPDGDTTDGDDMKPDGDRPGDSDTDGPDGDVPDGLCSPGQLRCLDEVRYRCSATRNDWLVVEDCAEKGMVCTPDACVSDGSGGGCRSSHRGAAGWLLLGLVLLGMLRVRVARVAHR